MKHALNELETIGNIISFYHSIAIFIDFDGTIAPIVESPNLARADEKIIEKLKELIKNSKHSIFIISGRSVNDLRSLIKLEGVVFIGLHGLEIGTPCGSTMILENVLKIQPMIEEIIKHLNNKLNGIPGIIIEDKKMSVAIHYRNTPETEVYDIKNIAKEVLSFDDDNVIDIYYGKKVIEFRLRDWHKGKAIDMIMEFLPNNSIPVVIGDDETDEEAFRNMGVGVSILINENPIKSDAEYYLTNQSELALFLGWLLRI